MKNMDTWRFAHDYCGKLWWKIGCVMIIPSALIHIPLYHSDKNTIGFAGLILATIQCIIMIASFYPTEKALKEHFQDEVLSTFMRKKVSRQRKKRVVMQWRNRREQPPGASCSCISCCPTECLRHGAGGRRRALGRNCRQGRHPRPGCACGSRG